MPRGKATAPLVLERSSDRGRRMRDVAVLRPIDQIPKAPGRDGIDTIGAWAYYLRLDGATITDILTIYPNGGVPDIDNPRLRARYGDNAEYYRERQRRRGLEYVGQTLTEAAMRRLVEIMANNLQDELTFLQEEVADARAIAKESDIPEVRNQGRRRLQQLERRIETLVQPFDPDELLAELNDIARAQQLAKVDPNVLRVMRAMIGEVNERVTAQIAHFQQGRVREGGPKLTGGGSDAGTEFEP